MRAIIVLAVLLAVAIASKASGPRGGDLRAARMTGEGSVAKKTPSAPDVVDDPAEPEPHVRKMAFAFFEVIEIANEHPGQTMAAVRDVADALLNKPLRGGEPVSSGGAS